MKKKIILFLSFLMMAMCLTGCTQEKTISGEKINQITQIANNVVAQKAYELPEGYTVSYPDNTTNARIRIRDNTKAPEEYLNVTFDISTEEIKLVEISVWSGISSMAIGTLMIVSGTVAVVIIFYALICFIKWLFKMITEKRRNKKA